MLQKRRQEFDDAVGSKDFQLPFPSKLSEVELFSKVTLKTKPFLEKKKKQIFIRMVFHSV